MSSAYLLCFSLLRFFDCCSFIPLHVSGVRCCFVHCDSKVDGSTNFVFSKLEDKSEAHEGTQFTNARRSMGSVVSRMTFQNVEGLQSKSHEKLKTILAEKHIKEPKIKVTLAVAEIEKQQKQRQAVGIRFQPYPSALL